MEKALHIALTRERRIKKGYLIIFGLKLPRSTAPTECSISFVTFESEKVSQRSGYIGIIIGDQNASAGGNSSLPKCKTYLFSAMTGLPSASLTFSG